jgi:hypothetical protein
LAVPATVWTAAAIAQVWGDCDVECGDRDRGYFLLVMLTAPLIPAGIALLSRRGVRRPSLAILGRMACAAVAAIFALLGIGLTAVAVGAFVDLVQENYPVNLDDPEGSRRHAIAAVIVWLLVALWAFAVAWAMVMVRRRVGR